MSPFARLSAHRRRARSIPVVLALALFAGGALPGCGSSSEPTSGASGAAGAAAPAGDPAIAAQLPAAVREKGTLVAATDATYAPAEFVDEDGSTIVGSDADLAAALSKLLGVRLELRNATYDSIIPGLETGRYDVAISSMTDTVERQETVDFVDYYSAGTSFYGRAGRAAVATLDELCGLKVAAQKATTQQVDAEEQSQKCAAAGEGTLTPVVFPDQNAVNLALSSGRADVAMGDSPVAAYQVKRSEGAFELGGTYGAAPYGIAVRRGSELVDPLRAAVQRLIDDGTYQEILERWGIEDGAIGRASVNGGTR